jgi:hypothetical protein
MLILTKAIFGLLFVLGLFYVSMKLLQKYTKIGQVTGATCGIKLDGTVYVDDSTKIVSMTHGSMGYLLLVGKSGNLLLDKYEKQ